MTQMIAIFDGRTRELGISLRRRFYRSCPVEIVNDDHSRFFTRHGFAYSLGRFDMDYAAYVDGQMPSLPGIDTSFNYRWLLIDQHSRCYDVTSFWCGDDNVRKHEVMSLPLNEGVTWVMADDLETVREMVVGALKAGATQKQLESLIEQHVSGVYGKMVWLKVDDIVTEIKRGQEHDLAQDRVEE